MIVNGMHGQIGWMLTKNHMEQLKMNGADLYGLSCRVPKPTEKQSKCSHTKFTQIDKGFRDWWTNEWISNFQNVEVDTFEDIPNTNNLRCSLCGYTRRY